MLLNTCCLGPAMLVPDVKHKTTVREIGRKLIKTKKAQNTKPIGAMLAPVPQDTQSEGSLNASLKLCDVPTEFKIQNLEGKKIITWPLRFTLQFVL